MPKLLLPFVMSWSGLLGAQAGLAGEAVVHLKLCDFQGAPLQSATLTWLCARDFQGTMLYGRLQRSPDPEITPADFDGDHAVLHDELLVGAEARHATHDFALPHR